MRQLGERAEVKGGANVVTAAAARSPLWEDRVAVASDLDAYFVPLTTSCAFW
jgi:hypothetical protein